MALENQLSKFKSLDDQEQSITTFEWLPKAAY